VTARDVDRLLQGSLKFESGDSSGWIGTDEAGKGDYFGPLVVAGVWVNEVTAAELLAAGVRDSKKISDRRAHEIAARIRETSPVEVVAISPERYNEMYAKIRNLNRLLAWAHARVIENLLTRVDCSRVISDQFGDERVLQRALMEKGRAVQLVQRPRAEDDVAVAAASIIARSEFLNRLRQLGDKEGVELAKGAGPPVLVAGRRLVEKHGAGALARVAKLHFKTTQQVSQWSR
jgi:ribonuclease HIII